MRTRTLIKVATASIQKNRMRAALTMLGIIIGVAAVIVMVAVGYGARNRIREQINNLGTNMIVITPGASQQGGVSQGAQAFPNLSLKDVDKIRSESQYVAAISPVIASRTVVIGAAACIAVAAARLPLTQVSGIANRIGAEVDLSPGTARRVLLAHVRALQNGHGQKGIS